MLHRVDAIVGRAAHLLALLATLVASANAWAIYVSPSPSYGSHTVYWAGANSTRCDYNFPIPEDPFYYVVDCWDLQESVNGGSWTTIATTAGSTQWSLNRGPGSYQYRIFWSHWASYGCCYAEGVAEGPTSVTVLVPPPVFSINSAPAVNEGSQLAFAVTPQGYVSGTYQVNFTTLNSSAIAGTHYVANSGTLTFTSASAQNIPVNTLNDGVVDGSRQVLVQLSSPTNGSTINPGASFAGGMIDNVNVVTFSIVSDQATTEGGPLAFVVRKTGATVLSHSVYVATANGSASAGSDYTARGETVNFAVGVTDVPFSVTTTPDTTVENDETLTLNLSSPSQFSVINSGAQSRTGTIQNDDVSFSITSSVSNPEGVTSTFTVTMTGVTGVTQSVNYTTLDGTATAGPDYTANSGVLQFPPGTFTRNVDVVTADDLLHEGNESYSVRVTNSGGATLTTGSGTIDDDNDDTVTGSALVSLAPNTTGYAPGATAGALSVDAVGNANYRLPIQVPPGTAGMQPDLALVYNSGGGNGHVGIGWAVAGLSAITRCPKTPAQDGGTAGIDGIDYDADDRFCLDGQRLILVTGIYGADGAEYRTEINQFAQIHSYGAVGAPVPGPQYFRVRTKSGRTYYYGNTADSAVEVGPGNSTIRMWAVNKIEDLVGNYMTFSYQDQSSQTDIEPTQIAYTLHNNGGLGATAFARVQFEYEAREAYGHIFQGGWAITNTTRRLKSIKTEAIARDLVSGASLGWQLVRDYQLSYDTGRAGVSRLIMVKECPGSGPCLPPTTFGWWNSSAAPTLAATSVTWPSGALNAQGAPLFGDFNGDGRTDLLMQDETYQPPASDGVSKLYLAHANGSGIMVETWTAPTGASPNGWHRYDAPADPNVNQLYTGDFNADGRTDIARVHLDKTAGTNYVATLYVYHSNGSAMVQAGTSLLLGTIPVTDANTEMFKFGDVDGDGRTDLIFGTYVGNATAAGQITSYTYRGEVGGSTYSGDFDGDGRVDLLVRTSGTTWDIRFSDGNAFTLVGQFSDAGYPTSTATPAIADVNGDGLDDVILISESSHTARAYLSKGDGHVAQAWTATGVYTTNVGKRLYIGDWNSDGRADIAYHNSAGTSLLFYVTTTANQLALLDTKSWENPPTGTSHLFSGDWNGDGIADLWRRQAATNNVYLTSSTGQDLVDKVTDGLGVLSTIVYAPMSDATVYSKGTPVTATHPAVVVQSTRPLVKSVTTDDGLSGTRSKTYAYERAIADVLRRGGFGFAKVTTTDVLTNIQSITNYSQTFPFIGMALSTEQKYNGVTLNSVTNTLAGGTPTGNVYFPHVQQRVVKTYEPNSAFTASDFVARSTTTNDFDTTFGNLVSITVERFETETQSIGEFKIQTQRDFYNDTTNWLIGQLICERTHDPNATTVRRTVGYEYATALPYRGLLTREIVEPSANGDVLEPAGFPTQCVGASAAGTRENVTLTTLYAYDLFGNPTTVTVDDLSTAVPSSQPARITQIAYGESNSSGTVVAANGRFAIQTTNPLSHIEQLQYDGRLGTLLQVRDANSQVTQWSYDAFGRQNTELRHAHSPANIVRTDIYRAWCTAATCPNGGKLKALTRADGAPLVAAETDRLGRTRATLQAGFDGKTVVSRIDYTNKGEIDKTSRPYIHDTAPASIRYDDYGYDALSRVVSVTVPSDAGAAQTTIDYQPGTVDQFAFRVATTNAAGQVTREDYHVRGLVDRVTTAAGAGASVQSDTKFTYDVFGNVTNVRVNGSSATDVINTYDILGRKLSMRDPDLAPQSGTTWQYRYFSFGDELRQQTDAKSQQTTFGYDVLGRMTQRTEPEGTTNFYFDGTKPKGALDRITAPGVNKDFFYDTLTRHNKTTTQVTGSGAGNGSYDVSRSFGIGDRVETITYPASTAYPLGLQVRYDFTSNGYLQRVKNASTNVPYFTLDEVTAEGQLQKATFGNNVLTTRHLYHAQSGNLDEIRTGPGTTNTVQNFHFDFSLIGNLSYRADVNAGIGERLTAAGAYDAQNRLTSVQRVVHTANHTSGAVQATTNFTYNALGNVLTKGGITGTYDYAATPQSSCPTGYTTTPGPHAVRRTGSSSANYRHFCYDRNGNQTRGWNHILNRQRTQTWTSYNMPATIMENSTSISFSYGADRQRFRQVNGFSGTTTIYVEGLFDREVTGATVNDVHYIVAYGQAVATFSSRNDAVTSTRYLHRDHAGSVTHVTNETGTVVQTLAYDAWGARRDPSNWTDYAAQPPAPTLRQPQYTGHEGLHDVGIVHMNGRIYDPKLGRVLSADPIVQFPGSGQSFNRYSYTLNNPLRYTDPSGFCINETSAAVWCGNPLSRGNPLGALGRSHNRPRVGQVTVVMSGGQWGFGQTAFGNAGTSGALGGCTFGPICKDIDEPVAGSGIEFTFGSVQTPNWHAEGYHAPYSGVIAEDTGDSSEGLGVAGRVAGYEQNYVGSSLEAYQVEREMLVRQKEELLDSLSAGGGDDFLADEIGNSLRGINRQIDEVDLLIYCNTGDPCGVIPKYEELSVLGAAGIVRAAAARGIKAASGTAQAVTHGHHAWPKYLGGPAKQDLARLPKSVHDAFHSGLDKILPRQRGTAYYEGLSPAARQQTQRDLADYTRAFDAKNGTRLYESMLRNGFPEP